MSGIDVIEEMTDEQVESMSGGELLIQEGGYYSQIRNTRKNATRLKEALMEHNMIMPFIFLMARQRDAVLFLDDPDRHVKLAGRLYDQVSSSTTSSKRSSIFYYMLLQPFHNSLTCFLSVFIIVNGLILPSPPPNY